MGKKNNSRGPKNPNDPKLNPKLISPNISVKDLDTMIYNQGVRVKVYKTLWCPNVKSIDGAEHDINCPICRGSSFVDVDCIETEAFIQGQSREHLISPEQIGQNWEEQVVLATFRSGVDVSYYTLVELVDYTDPMKELIQRQPSGSNVLSDITPSGYDDEFSEIEFDDMVNLSRVRTNHIIIDADNNRFVVDKVSNRDGNKYIKVSGEATPNVASPLSIFVPDVDRLQFKAVSVDEEAILLNEDGRRYYEGQDFIFDHNGDVEWLPCGEKPAAKNTYTIYYYALVAYRAIRALHSNRYLTDSQKKDFLEVVEAPQQWMLKKLYLFRKEDSESGQQLDPNDIFPKGE